MKGKGGKGREDKGVRIGMAEKEGRCAEGEGKVKGVEEGERATNKAEQDRKKRRWREGARIRTEEEGRCGEGEGVEARYSGKGLVGKRGQEIEWQKRRGRRGAEMRRRRKRS